MNAADRLTPRAYPIELAAAVARYSGKVEILPARKRSRLCSGFSNSQARLPAGKPTSGR